MKGPYGLQLNDGCKTCKLKAAGFFCQLPPAALKDFDAIKSTSTYPKGALLFMEGQDARGVFVLCDGDVKLSISSSEGKTLNMRVAKAGEILGLVAGISGAPYEVTAETVRPSQVAFVRREDFRRFVAKYPEVCRPWAFWKLDRNTEPPIREAAMLEKLNLLDAGERETVIRLSRAQLEKF